MKKLIYSLLIGISALSAIILDYQGFFELYKYCKPLTTILILFYPILFWNKNNIKYNSLIILALTFCLIGDVYLLDDSRFVYGLASFLIAHLFFSFAFTSVRGFSKNYWLLLLLLMFGGAYLLYLKSSLGDYIIPVSIYISVILFMCWQALSLGVHDKRKVLMTIGFAAVMFAFSDAVIAYNKFKNPFALSGLFILPTYWCSIYLLASSTIRLN